MFLKLITGKRLRFYFKFYHILFRCKIRLLDSFGTEAEFNLGIRYDDPIPGGQSEWSGSQLNLQQIMTFYRK